MRRMASWEMCGTCTHSEVISTRHSQSCTRSRKDSAENPAKTVEWIAPILAQAKNAAAACLRHRVWCQLPHLFIHKQGDKRDSPGHGQIDANGISLLDSPSLQDVGNPTSLSQELGIANLSGLAGLIGFVDDGRLVRIGISVTVEAVVGDVETSFGATKVRQDGLLVESQWRDE
jgi:hypothetical protein